MILVSIFFIRYWNLYLGRIEIPEESCAVLEDWADLPSLEPCHYVIGLHARPARAAGPSSPGLPATDNSRQRESTTLAVEADSSNGNFELTSMRYSPFTSSHFMNLLKVNPAIMTVGLKQGNVLTKHLLISIIITSLHLLKICRAQILQMKGGR